MGIMGARGEPSSCSASRWSDASPQSGLPALYGGSLRSPDYGNESLAPERCAEWSQDRCLISAGLASVQLVEAVLKNLVAEPPNQQSGAAWTVGTLGGVTHDVSDVDVFEVLSPGHL